MSPVPPVWVRSWWLVTLVAIPVGVFGEVFAEGSGELELARVDQLEDRHGGEHLIHRADAKARPARVRDPSLAVGQPVGVAEEHVVVLRSGRGGEADVFVMRANGTGIRPVTRTAVWDSAPDWGPR
jgi:hypothetical protein